MHATCRMLAKHFDEKNPEWADSRNYFLTRRRRVDFWRFFFFFFAHPSKCGAVLMWSGPLRENGAGALLRGCREEHLRQRRRHHDQVRVPARTRVSSKTSLSAFPPHPISKATKIKWRSISVSLFGSRRACCHPVVSHRARLVSAMRFFFFSFGA